VSAGRKLSAAEADEALELLSRLVAPMFDERHEGTAFWGFYLDHRPDDAELDDVVDRLRAGHGFYAVEMVWDSDLELKQRGTGRIVRTLDELRELVRRADALRDGMDHTRKKLLIARAEEPSGHVASSGELWGAADDER